MINALNLEWPDTGRKWPEGAKLEIRHVHAKWQDLAYWSDRPAPQDGWIYLSTLPNNSFDNSEKNGRVTA